MTACPGKARGLQPHDAVHVEGRLAIPWNPALPVRVEVVHRCETYGCPAYQEEWAERARNPEAVLRNLLGPRGMLAEERLFLPIRTQPYQPNRFHEPQTRAHREATMGAIRDALRPSIGTPTSDPDAFLAAVHRRVSARREA